MTMFDVIRYPVSDDPTDEELRRIPKPILQKWASRTWSGNFREVSLSEMAAALRHEILIWNETPKERWLRRWNTCIKFFKK